ncbi:MAG: hypothetical protein CMH50_04470 [Myxococcales bacterium]|nr:hypothetical protein [Myxococcales bacterium]
MLSALRSRGAQPGGGLLACIIAALVGAGTLAMRPDLTTAQVRVPEAGSVALRDLRAARSTRVTDQAETQRRRDDAAQAVPVVYDHARVAVDRVARLLREAYSAMAVEMQAIAEARKSLQDRIDGSGDSDREVDYSFALAELNNRRQRAQLEFANSLQIQGMPVDFDALDRLGYRTEVAQVLGDVLQSVYERPVVESRQRAQSRAVRGLTLRSPRQERFTSLEALDDLPALRKRLVEVVLSRAPQLRSAAGSDRVDDRIGRSLAQLLGHLVVPTATYNAAETADRQRLARHQIPVVVQNIARGEVLVRRGQEVTPDHVLLFKQINQQGALAAWLVALGAGLLIALLVACVHWFALRHMARYRPDARDLAFMAMTLVLHLAAISLLSGVLDAVAAQRPELHSGLLRPLLPVVAGALLVAFVLNGTVTLVFVVVSSPLIAIASTGDIGDTLPVMLGSLVGASLIDGARRRTDFLRAGVVAGLAAWGVSLGTTLIEGGAVSQEMGFEGINYVLGGVLAAVGIPMITPVIEWVFGYMTNLRLGELSNLDHPALRELALRAPGSYHHSMMVASLVEAGAQAIGRNPLLARVMAYYHDIGKGLYPEYFGENQRGENPHDKLKPSMSVLIIKKHVSEGQELARSYGLGEEIIDGIEMHHGSRVISYFYKKAIEIAPEGERVDIEDYSHHWRKPQYPEAALLMIADAVEAAAKTVDVPDPDRLRGLVQKMTNKIFAEGQLDECDLTLRDLHKIANAFHAVLVGIYHHRPRYQEPATKERRDSNSSTQHPKPDSEPTPTLDPTPNEASGSDDLRRLGH